MNQMEGSPTMAKIIFAVIILTCCTFVAFAQDETRRTEVFVGYSNLQADTRFDSDDMNDEFPGESTDKRTGLNGVNASVTGYLSRRVGITGDFSYHTKNESNVFDAGSIVCVQAPCTPLPGTVDARARVFNFLVGPQVKFTNSSRVEPFVRALAGVTHSRTRITTSGFGSGFDDEFSVNSTDFALALGGGLDVRVSDRVAIRAFQVDYNPVFLRSRDVDLFGETERFNGRRLNNVRFSVGVVFR